MFFEEDSGGNTGTSTETEKETNVEVTEVENTTEVETEVVVKPAKTKVKKQRVTETSTSVDTDELKKENQKLKVENKLQLLCNDNNLDAATVKELIPDFDNTTEETVESFVTKLVELTPKLTQPKKATPTPRIVPNEPKKDTKLEHNQKMSEYFGGGGGSKRVFGNRS